MEQIYEYIDTHWPEAIEDLKRYCAQPSISAQGIGITECAALTAELLSNYGLNAQILPVEGGNPVVFGKITGDSP